MKSWKHCSSSRLMTGVLAFCLACAAPAAKLHAQTLPQYDHVFLLIMENEGFKGIIGNQDAPILNALAKITGWRRTTPASAIPASPTTLACWAATPSGSPTTTRTGSQDTQLAQTT